MAASKRTPDAETSISPAQSDTPAIPFPIVGIGASAGGLAAFEAFFSALPSDPPPGMAFVLIQHLAPDHKSLLADLIRRHTRLAVFQAEDGMAVAPNCIYTIPPNSDLAILNGTLHLMEPAAPRGQRLPVDYFFHSLAQDQRELAIAIVLSGTGGDGALGLRAVKGEGGLALVQNPASAEYDGMPRAAIATGLADHVLPPAEMPALLLAYGRRLFGRSHIGPTDATAEAHAESALKKIAILLRTQTGHDFSQYKSSTVRRRVERRMVVHQTERLEGYVKLLQQDPAEASALFRDLLIGVTGFFRDPGAFQSLEEQVLPRLFASRPPGSAIRVWSVGCSSGEEAYSLAILLHERLETSSQGHAVQIFATDIDPAAIATARAGLYPAGSLGGVSPQRLVRYFTPEPVGEAYRVHKAIRDLVVFSEQDLIRDPPFSRLDLICCRNLLIYMTAELQRRVIPLFHYALNPGGVLFLGPSETVGEFDELFQTLDRGAKLFRRREDSPAVHSPFFSRLLSHAPIAGQP